MSLKGLVSKLTLNDILPGLKGNQCIAELDLNGCELDDEDLQKILEILKNDATIEKLKLGNNKFSNYELLSELIMLKSDQLTLLDISGFSLDLVSLSKLGQHMKLLQNLEVFVFQNIIQKVKAGEVQEQNMVVKQLMEAIFKIKTLKSIDFSKNKFSNESVESLFQ